MSDAQGRVQWADAARGLAIALVVLHHAAKRSVVAGSADWWLDVTGMLQTVRMPLFFAVAGVFAATWVGDRTTWPAMLRAKVLLFAWVYALWVVLRGLWFVLMPPEGREATASLTELLLRFVMPAGGWFIFALALMFVVAKATNGAPRPWVLGTASVVSFVFLADWVQISNPAWDGLGKYSVFFLLGTALRHRILALGEAVPVAVAAVVPVAWAVAYVGLATAGLEDAPVVGFALRLAGIAAGASVAVLLQRSAGLRALGRGTLPVYLAHQLLVVTAVGALSARYPFEQHGVLAYAAPVVIAVPLLLLTFGFGLLAPRLGLGWLFVTPAWLVRVMTPRPEPARPLAATRDG